MHKNQGFTLIEMMIILVIAAILMTVGVPSFFNMIQRNNVSTTSNEIVGALLYARSEAVRQEVSVTFTPEADGWLVTANGIDIIDHSVDNTNLAISEDLASDTVIYNTRGRANSSAGDSIDISYDGTLKSRVCLSLTGRPYIKKVDDGDCP
ncbi:MAG: GspH/FimT family pseudopilin [Candidatus Thiodiazotropha sp. (ex Lucinoma borealis)]|nr:GspH/FimT family pseudopilin [Candidatus Thiodiazotropha sp. (ex Lucinoma borealis)]MCU7868105.1 GspH/FimT family pseudopilin [Candidatus Thiodiazotropha sp. (ex Lucinoma borealis)]